MRINSGWCSGPLSHQISGQLNICKMRWRESFRLFARQNIRRAPLVVSLILCVERKQRFCAPMTARPHPRLQIRASIWPSSSSWLSPLSLFALSSWHSPRYWEGERPSMAIWRGTDGQLEASSPRSFSSFSTEEHFITTRLLASVKGFLTLLALKQLRLHGCKATDMPPAVHVHYIWRYRKDEPLEGRPEPNMLIKTWGKCIVRPKGVKILHFI